MSSLPVPAPESETSSAAITGTRLVFTGRQAVSMEPFEVGLPEPDEVVVHTRLSLMSTGTENIVFNRLFEPGTHWDGWVKYPFYPGYASVGRIMAVGAQVRGLRVGQNVAYRVGHASHARIKAANAYEFPDTLPMEHAVWFAFAKIAFMGARASGYGLGDTVLVVGAGPIGQMTVRWASAAGAKVVAVDAVKSRLALARAGGAHDVISQPLETARSAIHEAFGGAGPRVVVDSTGNAAVFEHALRIAGDRGTVVILGDTGAPSQQRLTPDVISRGLRIIGAHDVHNTPEWHDGTIAQLYFRLVQSGRFDVNGMISHAFAPERCADAYTLANTARGQTMGIAFDWRQPERVSG